MPSPLKPGFKELFSFQPHGSFARQLLSFTHKVSISVDLCVFNNKQLREGYSQSLRCPKTGITIHKQGFEYGLNVLVEHGVLDKQKENLLHTRNSKPRWKKCYHSRKSCGISIRPVRFAFTCPLNLHFVQEAYVAASK